MPTQLIVLVAVFGSVASRLAGGCHIPVLVGPESRPTTTSSADAPQPVVVSGS